MRASMVLIGLPLALVLLAPVHAREVLTGADAFGTWKGDAPGVSRHIKPTDLSPPTHHENDPEAPDFDLKPKVVDAPQGKMPDVPKGFAVQVRLSCEGGSVFDYLTKRLSIGTQKAQACHQAALISVFGS